MGDHRTGEAVSNRCCGLLETGFSHLPNCPLVRWAAASIAAFDEACPLSGDDYLIPAAVMDRWREARHACERAERTSDTSDSGWEVR